MTTIVKNKNGIEFDIDTIATDLNGKMDKDGVNAECPILLSRTPNSQGGVVEIWSDGYCVQTGIIGQATSSGYPKYTITLEQSYKDTNYVVMVTGRYTGDTANGTNYCYANTTTTISIVSVGYGSFWRTEGYIK